MTLKRLTVILATLAATGCGGTASTPSTSAAQSAARDYQSTGQSLAMAVAQYQSAAAAMTDVAGCHAAETDYEAHVGPMLDRMKAASEVMDHYMDEYMGPAAGDMECVADAMQLEYQRHVGTACDADMSANHTEAAQHASAMSDWLEHQRVRYEQMGAASGMMPSTTDTTWTCQQTSGGSFTMGDHTWTPTQTPSTPSTTTTPISWPTPCGGQECPCSGSSGSGTTSPTSGSGMPGGMM